MHVWDAIKMETLAILKGQHERGVCAVDFSGNAVHCSSYCSIENSIKEFQNETQTQKSSSGISLGGDWIRNWPLTPTGTSLVSVLE